MRKDSKAAIFAGRLLSGVGLAALVSGGAFAQSISDEIIVTSQRTEQSLQDVPIAVSAFGGQDLQARQLESFTDIQFNVPNFAFSKSQFTSSTISIRGIGALAVGASTEPSTSIHMNDFNLNAPRLFETEFFDIERLEILRGPQGTLFGRNATGGVVNVITAKASTDGVSGYADAEYGSYNSVKAQGALNIPLSESLAFRLAGTTIQRDGYTTNLFDGSDIDDRNIFALRGSVRWLPTDNTTIDFVTSYMKEDDSRTRSQKVACTEGPLSPLLGCDPNGPRSFGRQDLRATFFANTSMETLALATGNPAAAAFGLFSLTTPQLGQTPPQSMRQVSIDTRPEYSAEESIFMLNLKHDFETISFKLNGGWGNSKVYSRQEFDDGVGPLLTLPAAIGTVPALANFYAGGFPLSDFDVGILGPNDGLVGAGGGFVQARGDRYQAVDMSIGETDYWSVEGIITSDFDGPFNFLLGSSYAHSNGYADFAVAATGLDYFAVVAGTLAAIGAGAPGAATNGYMFYTPYYWNDTDDSFLKSFSVFGEMYIDFSDQLRFTGGIRHNWDTKGVRDRGNLLESTSATNPAILGGVPPIVPLGTPSVRPLLDANELVQCVPLGSFCATGGVNDFRIVESDFNSTTGRAVLQWMPTDNAQYYISYTRGHKPGGFNPRTLFAGVPLTFDSESINAYEAGVKATMGALRASVTGFYYDYSGLQVSRIVANTSVNDNIDATVWGLEGEFVWRPTDRLTLNMNAAYLNTKMGTFATVDTRNPLGGSTGNTLLADILDGSNCVLVNNGAPSLIGQTLPGPLAPLNPLIASPFTICSQFNTPQIALGGLTPLQVINATFSTNYQVVDGISVDATGNELPGSPKFQIGGGVQYDMPLGGEMVLTPRVDVYYQTKMFWNIFNTMQDQIDGYAYVNAMVRFGPEDGRWHFRLYGQNLTNNDAITGAFNSGQGAGNFTNLFILEPRRWGAGVHMNF